MKVLTIKQPWATLIMLGYKEYEFRSWKTKYRGPLLIHAGLNIDKEAKQRLAKYLPEELPVGKILGQVNLCDCIKCDKEFEEMCRSKQADIYLSPNYKQDYAWQIKDVQVFEQPIEVNGKLGLWNLDI